MLGQGIKPEKASAQFVGPLTSIRAAKELAAWLLVDSTKRRLPDHNRLAGPSFDPNAKSIPD
jgi:hypothetical protein